MLKGFIDKRNQAQAVNGSGLPLLWIALVAVVLGSLLLVFLSKTGKLKPLIEKVLGIWVNLRKGLFSVFTLEKKGLFLFFSFLIWVLYFMMAWLVMLAFDETRILGIDAALTVFTLGSIAMAMPFPGGTGSYHILVPAGLTLFYGLAPDKALAFTVVFHAWQTLVLIVFGFIAMIGSQFYKPKSNV